MQLLLHRWFLQVYGYHCFLVSWFIRIDQIESISFPLTIFSSLMHFPTVIKACQRIDFRSLSFLIAEFHPVFSHSFQVLFLQNPWALKFYQPYPKIWQELQKLLWLHYFHLVESNSSKMVSFLWFKFKANQGSDQWIYYFLRLLFNGRLNHFPRFLRFIQKLS